MARLAVAAVLLTLLVVALCRVIDGKVDQVAASPYYPFEPPEEAAVLPDGAYVEYNGDAGTSVAFVPPYLDGTAHDEAAAAAVQSYVFPTAAPAAIPEGAVSPVDDADQGFLRFPCRYRHMRWARRHGGLHRQDVYYGFHRHGEGFQSQDQVKRLAEVPVELVYGGKSSERVALPVVETDPDSRQDAAVAAEEPVHGEEEDEDEMARAWRRFHHGRRSHHHRRHHHHQNEHEEDDHEQREEGAPMKRFRFHRHDGNEESRTKRFHHDKDDESDDEDELEEMARRWIRKALMRGRIHHHGRRFHHHHLRFRHRAEDAASEEEEKGGVMSWLKDFVNRF